MSKDDRSGWRVKQLKQRKRIVILRDDHLGDPLGRIFLDTPTAENEGAILECLREYLGHRVRIVRAEFAYRRVEIDIELQALVEEAARLAAAADDLRIHGARRNAVSLFHEALQLDPLNREAAKGLGLLMLELDNLSGALSMLKRARESGPDDAELLFALGRVCLKLERKASAVTYFESAFELDPAHFGVRRILTELGRKPKPPLRSRLERPQRVSPVQSNQQS